MQQNDLDVVILKPTPVFLSFLATQFPDIDLPDLRQLQADNTAYSLRRQDDEGTFDEIERNFEIMFRHEISRWVGEEACNQIQCTFLDFLCCFKFKLHSQIVLMESSMHDAHQLVCIKPRSVLLKWIKSSLYDPADDKATGIEHLKLSHLQDNATILVKNFGQSSDAKHLINNYYRPIFKAEMIRIYDEQEQWPDIDSYQTFSRYFAVDIHSKLIHLEE